MSRVRIVLPDTNKTGPFREPPRVFINDDEIPVTELVIAYQNSFGLTGSQAIGPQAVTDTPRDSPDG